MVVESFSAIWWLAEAEIVNAVAVMGASVSEKQARLITELVPEDGRVWIYRTAIRQENEWPRVPQSSSHQHRFVRCVKIEDGKQPTDLSAEELHIRLPVV